MVTFRHRRTGRTVGPFEARRNAGAIARLDASRAWVRVDEPEPEPEREDGMDEPDGDG